MKNFMTVLAFVGAVACYRDLEAIIADVIVDTDINPTDGIISTDELKDFIGSFGTDTNGQVTKHEFTTKWINTYDDNHADTNTFFNNLDYNKDHVLTEEDLVMHMHPSTGQMDGNGDGIITVEEFSQFIRLMHPGHGNH